MNDKQNCHRNCLLNKYVLETCHKNTEQEGKHFLKYEHVLLLKILYFLINSVLRKPSLKEMKSEIRVLHQFSLYTITRYHKFFHQNTKKKFGSDEKCKTNFPNDGNFFNFPFSIIFMSSISLRTCRRHLIGP